MDELEIKMLEANGYAYINGGIVDAEGNYVSALELHGKKLQSEASKDLWEEGQALDKQHSNAADPLDNIKKYEEDPLNNVLSQDDKNYYPLYSEKQMEKDLPTYDNADIFEKEVEKSAIEKEENSFVGTLRELQEAGYENITEEHINAYKKNDAFIKQVETEDPSLRVKMNALDDTNKQLEENAWYNPANISLHIEKAWLAAANFILPETLGMEGSDEQKKKYEEALDTKKKLQAPALKIIDDVLKEKEEKMKAAYDASSFADKWGTETDILRYGLNEIEAERYKIQSYVDDSYVFNPLKDSKFAINMATTGIQGAFDAYAYNAKLHKKIENGEELTENERMVAESLAVISKSQGTPIEQKGLYDLTRGTFDSAAFLVGGAPGRLVMKGATNTVGRKVEKGVLDYLAKQGIKDSGQIAKAIGFTAKESVNMFGQAVLHPESHVKGLNKYYGNIYFDKDEEGNEIISTDRRTYKTLIDEIDIQEDALQDALIKEQDPEVRGQINAQLKKIDTYRKSIKAPESALNSAIYGFTETLKENAVENYGGALASKIINNRFTRKIATKPWVKNVTNSKVGRAVEEANELFSTAKSKFNDFTGVGGTKLIGNNAEEIAEEVMTQLLPVWGETEEEAIMRRGELFEGSFYGQVAGQTLLMGGLMKAAYSPVSAYNAIQRSKDLKDKRKAFKDMVKEFKNGGITDSQVEELLMSSGEGNFTVQEYNNKIAKLRSEGKDSEANDIERNKTFNIGKSLVALGKGKAFIRAMNNAIASGNIPAQSIPSVQEAIQEVKILQGEMKELGNLRNKDYVLELKSKKRYTQKQISDLEKKRSEAYANENLTEENRKAEVEIYNQAINDIKKHEGRIDKAIAHETSSKMKNKLEEEAQVTQDIIKEYNKLRKQDTTGVNSKKFDRELALEEVKNKYGATVSNGTYQNAAKQFDKYLLAEVVKEVITAQNKVVDNKIETVEEPVEQDPEVIEVREHLEDIEANIDAVTEIVNAQEDNMADPDNTVVDYGAEPDWDPDTDTLTPVDDKTAIDADEAFFDDMPRAKDGTFENEPFNNLVKAIKDRVAAMEAKTGEKPTFEDYIEDLIDKGQVPIENFRGHMRALALGWSGAQLGKTNWKELYSTMFQDVQAIKTREEDKEISVTTKTPEVEAIQEKSEIEATNKKSVSNPVTYEPTTGEPVYTTPNKNKTYGTEHKPNYSAIEFDEVVEEIDGKKVYRKVNSPIPRLNEKSNVSFKDLVNPNKNNIGDKLYPTLLSDGELANIPVSIRDKYGRQIKSVPFSEWVTMNIPEGMSFEDFKNTKEYRDKVPMVYKDAQGVSVAYVPEVEWFNVTSVGDSNQEVDEVDLDNPSESLKKDIEQNRKQTSDLREAIINGSVEEVEIVDNLSFPPLQKIAKTDEEGNPIPTKTLSEVAPDSQIVWMKSTGNIVDMNGRTIDMENILNLGNEEEGFLMTETIEEDGIKKKLPINRNRTHYLTHVATVDGVKKYIALNVQRKNENQEDSVNKEDLETARWIAAINNVVKFHNHKTGSEVLNNTNHPLHMSLEQAEDLRRQIKKITGTDIKDKYTDLIESLVAYQDRQKNKKITYGSDLSRYLRAFNKKTGEFTSVENDFQQNTSLSMNNKPMIKIAKTENGFVVEKIADTYDQHLKNRLSTNIMGYNVGTEANPVYTIAVQQKIKLRPIVKENTNTKEVLDKKIEEQKVTPEVKNKIEEVNTEITSTELTNDQKQKRKEALERATALAKQLNLDIRNINEVDDLVVSEMSTAQEVENSISIIEGLTIKQEEDIIKWLFSQLSNRDTDFSEVRNNLSRDMTLKIEELNQSISDLQEFKDSDVILAMINTLEGAKNQAEQVLINMDSLLNEASLRAVNTSFILDEFEEDSAELNEKDFSKASNETKPIDKVGTALKRIFAQVTDGNTGFMGLDTFASFKQMYDTVSLSLSSDVNITPNFTEMINLLKKKEDSTTWMKPLIERLEQADEQVKNQFVYNVYKQKVYAKFATLAFDKDNGVNSNIYDSNSNEAKRAIIEKWKENFKRSPINKEGKINTEVLSSITEEWNSWFDSGTANQSTETYKKWLGNFGIKLSDRTWEALRNGELNVSEGGGKLRKVAFKDLFSGLTASNSDNRTGLLFTNLMKYSLMNKDKEEIEFYDNTKNHPFEDMNTILNQLAELENQYNPSYGSTSRYVAGKSVTEIESFNYFYEQFKKLKKSALSEDKQYLKDLKELSFSQDSFLLNMLMEDDIFASQFGHGIVDLMALKELYKKSPMFAGIDELSSIDYMFAQRAMFQNRNQGQEKEVPGLDFDVRMAHMNTLTNSDKGRMMLLKTAVFDLYKQSESAFEITETGDINFKPELKNLLYNQLVLPELSRMVSFIKNSSKTNIKNYDKGAIRFNLIPGLNTLGTKENIVTFIKNNKNLSKEDILKKVEATYGELVTSYIQDNIVKEAIENVADLNQFNSEIDGFNNAEYLKQRKGTVEENMKIAELDFIINSMITNMNYMQLMAGDPALYYKSSKDVASTDVAVQTKISEELAINLGKRMAAMIAPGSVLANSNNNTYMQVFLEDINGIADNILDIVEWHYTPKDLSEEHTNGMTYRDMFKETIKGNRDYINILADRFDRVAEFIDIESTDAQEVTTTKEHLYVLEKQGRLSKEIIDRIKAKLEAQREYFSVEGNTVENMPKEISLNSVIKDTNTKDDGRTELEILLQPIKPVYTGTIYDLSQDVNRMMYIKSSSFPLIPELTAGRKLDDLRKNMEEVERVYKTTVRASYQSANKVGGLTSDNTVKDFTQPIVANNMLTLKREHFKIQQDVPFKSKKVQDDTVSMGTQIFKLLMGDGIMDMDGFEYEGEIITGLELQEKFHTVFSDMIGIKKEKFLTSLGLDKNMQSKDPTKTLEKLQRLLIKEAKSRGFSKQDLKILDLVKTSNGETTFKLPLWLTGNSNKYESMLNALINNKIFKQKIPGNKFVTGSEAGFEVTESMKGIDQSRIIHIGNFEGKTLQSTRKKDGGLSKAQILVPSKFKMGGKLIDLFEEFNGEDGIYVERVNGVLKIKEHMIDKKLLEQFVFRIPTSSHGLGSSVEIVGFLPPESGDLIVTPKGFVAQMGQDFDIDSLTAYQYNHIVMEDGSVKELNEENRDAYIEEKTKILDSLITLHRKGDLEAVVQLADNIEGLGDLSAIRKESEFIEYIDELKKDLKKDFDLKLLENKFIKIHNSVYSNPKAQKNINKVLSMAFAEKQADEIESLTAKSSNTFNILSPKYQMNKMNAGSTGQDAIGIYAKGVTLHSLIQQAKSKGQKIALGIRKKNVDIPKKIKIGNLSSDGVLGKMFSLPSKDSLFRPLNRKISTILDERTNTGTDNEKAQILGRTGLNHTDAIAVDNLLSLLGFDAEYNKLTKEQYDENKPFHRTTNIDGKTVYYTEHSIPYLLHSQPIIKEYFSIINEKESITTEFSGKAKEEALKELLVKYGKKGQSIYKGRLGNWVPKGNTEIFVSKQDNGDFEASMLQNQIILGKDADKNSQLEILAMYVDLIDEAKKVKTMMQHVDLSNLGKSMWESTTKAEEFREFFSNLDENGVLGAEHLIGDIEFVDTLKEGQIDLGDGVALTPKTNQGIMVGTALSLSESLFTNLFPAKNKYINSIINTIFKDSNINESNSFAVIKAKEQIFQEVKKYLTSAEGLGIFNKSAKEVRKDLFIDNFSEGHLSLSSYIGNLFNSDSEEFANGLSKVRNNLFLNHLKYNVGENGKPSLITFNNQESFEANQEAIYASFKELIAEDLSLPRKNGEYYSTRLLAQELIAYSYASGGVVQGALEFHKFLPIEYLDDMTYKNKKGQSIPISERLRSYNTFNRVEGNQNILGKFIRQYFQNNPESLVQIEMKEETLSNGDKIYTPKETTDLNFIANKVKKSKSKLKQDKWKIYEKVEGQPFYREIEVLGELGMAEYEFGKDELTSNLGEGKPKPRNISSLEFETIENDRLGTIPKNGSKIVSFLGAISTGEYGNYENMVEIAEYLMQFVPENATFEYKEGSFKGRVTGLDMYLNLDNIDSNEDLAVTFMHETLHVITSPYINQYLDEFGEIASNAPSEIIGLNNVLIEYRNKLKLQDVDKYNQFIAKWNKYREERANNIPSTVEFTPEEIQIYYPSVNLKEFIATSLGNNKEFKQVAGKMEYLETGGSILKKFGSFITQLIKRIGKTEGIQENTIALQAISKSMELIESIKKSNDSKKPVESNPEISNEEMKSLIETYSGAPEYFEEDGNYVDYGSTDNIDLEGNYVDYGSTDNIDLEGPGDGPITSLLPMMKRTKNKCK